MALGVLMLVLVVGVALAALRIRSDNSNTLRGTYGDVRTRTPSPGRSAADQPVGGSGPDRLEGDDTLVGGEGQDRTFTGEVFAFDGDKDYVNCNGESRHRILAWTSSTAAPKPTPARDRVTCVGAPRPARGRRCR